MKKVDFEFAQLEIHDRFVVGRSMEGVEIDPASHRKVMDEVRKEIVSPLGLIIDEVNSYSIACEVFELIRNDPQIACCAVVKYRKITEAVLTPVGRFMKKPFAFFDSLEEAERWVLEVLNGDDDPVLVGK